MTIRIRLGSSQTNCSD